MKSTIIIFIVQFFITFAAFAQINIIMEDQSVQAGSVISVPVYAESPQSLGLMAFQFALNWDSNLLEYQSLDNFGIAGLDEDAFGTPDLTGKDNGLMVLWEDYPNIFFIGSSAQLFNINFRVKDNFTSGNSTEISICANCANEFYNQNLSAVAMSHQNAQISVSSLPIELITFEAYAKEDNTVRLNWATATETNNSHFEIEHRSNDKNKDWSTLGKINGAGTTSEKQQYQFLDHHPIFGDNFYRLKQYDVNGNFKYSDTRIVQVEKTSHVVTWNNPVKNQLFIQFKAHQSMNLNLEIYSIDGQLLEHQTFDIQKGSNVLEWNMHHFPSGLYWVKSVGNNMTPFKLVKE